MPGFSFQYDTLEQGNIRLLKWKPGSYNTGQISFTMQHFPVNATPGYAALSYMWGEAVATEIILVDGKLHEIRQNLMHALQDLQRHIQHQDRPQYLWVDAICINQENIKERTHQVQDMRRIFAQASTTWAYLGPEDKNTVHGFDATKHANPSPIGLFALQDLMKRPYFSRIWIVQEIVVAHQVMVYSGRHATAWKNLESIARRFEDHTLSLSASNKYLFGSLRLLCLERINASAHRSSLADCNLLSLVTRYGTNQCQDSRDRIFALLGLHSCAIRDANGTNISRSNITPDYSRTKIDIIMLFLIHTQSLDINSSSDPYQWDRDSFANDLPITAGSFFNCWRMIQLMGGPELYDQARAFISVYFEWDVNIRRQYWSILLDKDTDIPFLKCPLRAVFKVSIEPCRHKTTPELPRPLGTDIGYNRRPLGGIGCCNWNRPTLHPLHRPTFWEENAVATHLGEDGFPKVRSTLPVINPGKRLPPTLWPCRVSSTHNADRPEAFRNGDLICFEDIHQRRHEDVSLIVLRQGSDRNQQVVGSSWALARTVVGQSADSIKFVADIDPFLLLSICLSPALDT